MRRHGVDQRARSEYGKRRRYLPSGSSGTNRITGNGEKPTVRRTQLCGRATPRSPADLLRLRSAAEGCLHARCSLSAVGPLPWRRHRLRTKCRSGRQPLPAHMGEVRVIVARVEEEIEISANMPLQRNCSAFCPTNTDEIAKCFGRTGKPRIMTWLWPSMESESRRV